MLDASGVAIDVGVDSGGGGGAVARLATPRLWANGVFKVLRGGCRVQGWHVNPGGFHGQRMASRINSEFPTSFNGVFRVSRGLGVEG